MLSVVIPCTLALLLIGASGQQTPQTCPVGWLQWELNFCYLFVNTSSVNWVNAHSECQERRGHLLRIESIKELNFIRKVWESTPALIPQSEMYWTDLNNLPMDQGAATNLSFMWGNDAFALDSILKGHWDKEPDNTAWKDCASVNIQGALTMEECSDRKPYICEYKLATDEACPMDWHIGYNRHYCYKISGIRHYYTRKSWTEARKICEGNNNNKTTLITLTSKEVQNFVSELLGSVNSGRLTFWTSLNDIDNEGQFMWAGNQGQPFTLKTFQGKWKTEPDNLGGNEHCVSLLPYDRWSDRSCEDTLNFACRMAVPGGPKTMNFGCGSWRRAGRKCVYTYSTKKTWKQARQFCQSAGGDLLSFQDQTEADWMAVQTKNDMVLQRFPGFWIGLNDQQKEGSYVWADGSPALQYILNWDKEPNSNSYCSVMNNGGLFADFNCHYVKTGSVCEEPTKNCAPNWQLFNGHCYLVDTTRRSRWAASRNCNQTSSSYQGRLFALNSAAEKSWIMSQLPTTQKTGVPHRFWSGLVNRGGWVWENVADRNPRTTQDLVKWSTEPNNRNNEDCVEILANGYLNDAVCDVPKAFVCQRAPSGMPFQPVTQKNSHGAAVPVAASMSAILMSLLAPVLYRTLL